MKHDPASFSQVPLAKIVPERELPADIYVKIGRKFIRFKPKEESISVEKYDLFLAKNVSFLYPYSKLNKSIAAHSVNVANMAVFLGSVAGIKHQFVLENLYLGIAGEDIYNLTRIVTFANIFDNTVNRFKKELEEDLPPMKAYSETLRPIKTYKGTKLDPELVNLCLPALRVALKVEN